MNRATGVYIIMILALGVGLWVILTLGSVDLTPPEDIGGRWDFAAGNVGGGTPQTSQLTGPMVIEQSGRFFRVSFANGPQINLQLADSTVDGRNFTARLTGGPWTIQVVGARESDELDFTITGPQSATIHAHCAERTAAKADTGNPVTPTTLTTTAPHAQD